MTIQQIQYFLMAAEKMSFTETAKVSMFHSRQSAGRFHCWRKKLVWSFFGGTNLPYSLLERGNVWQRFSQKPFRSTERLETN